MDRIDRIKAIRNFKFEISNLRFGFFLFILPILSIPVN